MEHPRPSLPQAPPLSPWLSAMIMQLHQLDVFHVHPSLISRQSDLIMRLDSIIEGGATEYEK